MRPSRPLLSVITAWLMASTLAPGVPTGEPASFRVVPIPAREHGYSNFASTVIASASELKPFLQTQAKGQGMGWNAVEAFEKALAGAKLEFARESLVLLRHTEGSGSVEVSFREPRLEGRRLVCRIDREEPDMGTADMAYYCFALAVDRTRVSEVMLSVSGADPTLLPIANVDPQTLPPLHRENESAE